MDVDVEGVDDDVAQLPMWKTYLYRLEQQAPKPKPIVCLQEAPGRPPYYGDEFHGAISREECDELLSTRGDGAYLIRESQRATGQYTLSIRFEGATKHFRLYYDGQHFVGEKRFDAISDLVADGLIIFYLESKAADYIDELSRSSNYAESPYYLAYAARRRSAAAKFAPVEPVPTPCRSSPKPVPRMGIAGRAIPGAGPSRRLRSVTGDESDERLVWATGSGDRRDRTQRSESFGNGQTARRHSPNRRVLHSDNTSTIPSATLLGDPGLIQRRDSSGTMSYCSLFMDVMASEKPHVFKLHTFKGPHWCDYCANYLWGLIAQGYKCQDCGFNAHKRCSETAPNDCMPDMKYVKRTFGVDLTTLVKAQNALIPSVVEICITEIEARGMHFQGLYRISGILSDIEALRMAFDKDGEATRSFIERSSDIHTIACVLKLFFRLLPIPLITFDVYFKLIEIITRNSMSVERRLDAIRSELQLLPAAHFHTLKYLIAHLHRVADRFRENLMSAENLATVFAPTLMRPPEIDSISAGHSALKNERDLIEQLILYSDVVLA